MRDADPPYFLQCLCDGRSGPQLPSPTPPDALDVRGDDPWTALRDEVDAMNRWYGERGNPCSAWVGWWPATGWYGGCGYDGEPMEEMADADGDTPEDSARNLVRLMAEYRERVDRQREEDNSEPCLEEQPPVPGGTTAIRDGRYVTEDRRIEDEDE